MFSPVRACHQPQGKYVDVRPTSARRVTAAAATAAAAVAVAVADRSNNNNNNNNNNSNSNGDDNDDDDVNDINTFNDNNGGRAVELPPRRRREVVRRAIRHHVLSSPLFTLLAPAYRLCMFQPQSTGTFIRQVLGARLRRARLETCELFAKSN